MPASRSGVIFSRRMVPAPPWMTSVIGGSAEFADSAGITSESSVRGREATRTAVFIRIRTGAHGSPDYTQRTRNWLVASSRWVGSRFSLIARSLRSRGIREFGPGGGLVTSRPFRRIRNRFSPDPGEKGRTGFLKFPNEIRKPRKKAWAGLTV